MAGIDKPRALMEDIPTKAPTVVAAATMARCSQDRAAFVARATCLAANVGKTPVTSHLQGDL